MFIIFIFEIASKGRKIEKLRGTKKYLQYFEFGQSLESLFVQACNFIVVDL